MRQAIKARLEEIKALGARLKLAEDAVRLHATHIHTHQDHKDAKHKDHDEDSSPPKKKNKTGAQVERGSACECG